MRRLLAPALLVALACGADVQADRVCVTTAPLSVTGLALAPSPLPVGPATLRFSIGAAVPMDGRNGVHDVRVLFRSFALTSAQASGFVTSLAVAALPPAGSGLPRVTLGTYQRAPGTADAVVEVTGQGTDLYPYLAGGALQIELSGVADPRQAPGGTYSADARLCAEVSGSVSYL